MALKTQMRILTQLQLLNDATTQKKYKKNLNIRLFETRFCEDNLLNSNADTVGVSNTCSL